MKHSYSTNWDRAHQVFDALIDQKRRGIHPFDHSNPPQVDENMPENLNRETQKVEHALFLWTSCYYMRGGIDSEVAFRRLTLIYERKPYLFSPAWMSTEVDLDIVNGEVSYGHELIERLKTHDVYKELSAELKGHGLGFGLEDNTRFWILNAIKLHKFWHGNPAELFHWITDYDDLVDKIANKRKFSLKSPHGFLGFQEKMVSMIAYFLAATNVVDRHTIPVPVDFHVLRMLLSTEIIVPKWKVKKEGSIFSPRLLEIAREVTEYYCHERRIEMIELCDALWLFSRAMCSWHPDNISSTPDKSHKRKQEQKLRTNRRNPVLAMTSVGRPPTEAEGDIGEKVVGLGRKSRVLHLSPMWTTAQQAVYDRSCRMCRLESVCKRAIPAAPYYLKGQVHLRDRSVPERNPMLIDLKDVPIRVIVLPWDKEATRIAAAGFLNEGFHEAAVEDHQGLLSFG